MLSSPGELCGLSFGFRNVATARNRAYPVGMGWNGLELVWCGQLWVSLDVKAENGKELAKVNKYSFPGCLVQ